MRQSSICFMLFLAVSEEDSAALDEKEVGTAVLGSVCGVSGAEDLG